MDADPGVARSTEHRRRLIRGLYLTALAIGLAYWGQPTTDPDLGTHLVGGAWIADHHQVPVRDFINAFTPYWHDSYWLAQLLIFQSYRVGGYYLLQLGVGVLFAYWCKIATDIIVLRAPRHVSVSFLILCLLASTYLMGVAALVRPQLGALVILGLVLRRLIQEPSRWELPFVFVATVVLANSHSFWVLVPALWAVHRCLPRITGQSSPSAAYAWGGFFLLVAAALVSPYGIGSEFPLLNYAEVWELMRTPPELQDRISELQPTLSMPGPRPWVFAMVFLLMCRIVRWRHLTHDAANTIVCFVFAALAFRAWRFLPMFGILGLPYLARHSGERMLRWSRRFTLLREGRIDGWVVVAACVAAVAVAAVSFPRVAQSDLYVYTFPACAHVAKMQLEPRPPRSYVVVGTAFNIGGWCRWTLYREAPQRDFRVTTDGRTSSVPISHFDKQYQLDTADGDWQSILREWNPDVLVVLRGSGLDTALRLNPAIARLDYQDDKAAVFAVESTVETQPVM